MRSTSSKPYVAPLVGPSSATRSVVVAFPSSANNGAWKVFDQVTYMDQSAWGLETDAEEVCDRLNGAKKVQRAEQGHDATGWETKPRHAMH